MYNFDLSGITVNDIENGTLKIVGTDPVDSREFRYDGTEKLGPGLHRFYFCAYMCVRKNSLDRNEIMLISEKTAFYIAQCMDQGRKYEDIVASMFPEWKLR